MDLVASRLADRTLTFAAAQSTARLAVFGNGQRLDEFLSDFPTVSREQALAVLELARRALTGDADPPG